MTKPLPLPFVEIPRDHDPLKLHQITDALADKAGWLEPPRLLYGHVPATMMSTVTAAAMPNEKAIVVFPALLKLPLQARIGTLAHEMGHLMAGHRPLFQTAPWALVAGGLAGLASPLLVGLWGLLLTAGAPAAAWLAMWLRQHRQEREADTLAVALVGARIVLNTYADETVPMSWRKGWRRRLRGYPTRRPWLLRLAADAGMSLDCEWPTSEAAAPC